MIMEFSSSWSKMDIRSRCQISGSVMEILGKFSVSMCNTRLGSMGRFAKLWTQKEFKGLTGKTVKQSSLVLMTLPFLAMLLLTQSDCVYGNLFLWMNSIYSLLIVENTTTLLRQGREQNTLLVCYIPMIQLRLARNLD